MWHHLKAWREEWGRLFRRTVNQSDPVAGWKACSAVWRGQWWCHWCEGVWGQGEGWEACEKQWSKEMYIYIDIYRVIWQCLCRRPLSASLCQLMLLKNEALREWLGWTSSGIFWSASPFLADQTLRQLHWDVAAVCKGVENSPLCPSEPLKQNDIFFHDTFKDYCFQWQYCFSVRRVHCCWLHLKGCKQGFYMLLLHLFQCFCFGKVHSLIDLRHVWHSQLLATAQILWSCQSLLESRDECLDKGFTRFPSHSCFLLFSFAIFWLAQVAHQCLGFTTLLLADTHRHVSLLELDKKTFH